MQVLTWAGIRKRQSVALEQVVVASIEPDSGQGEAMAHKSTILMSEVVARRWVEAGLELGQEG